MPLVFMKEFSGIEYEVHASKFGAWTIQLPTTPGERPDVIGSGDTLEKAIANARATIARQKTRVHVPFITVQRTQSGYRTKRQVATGINYRTRNIIIQGSKEQKSTNDRVLSDNISEKEVDELIEAYEAVDEWNQVIKEIQAKHQFILGTKVREELEKATRLEEA